MLQQQTPRTPPRLVLPRAGFLKSPSHESLRSSQHWLSPRPTSNRTCRAAWGVGSSCTPGILKTCVLGAVAAAVRENYQGPGLALVECSWPHCHCETEVRAEFPLLAPQRPPPAPVPYWSFRDEGGPPLHLHSSFFCSHITSALGPAGTMAKDSGDRRQ